MKNHSLNGKFSEDLFMSLNSNTPSLQDIFQSMQVTEAYRGTFTQFFTLLNILLALLIRTVTVERSFSEMKMIKTRLRNRPSDCNLDQLMKIAVEGPEIMEDVPFQDVLEILNHNNF